MVWTVPEPVEFEGQPKDGQSVIVFTVGKDGRARNCRLESGPDPATFLPFSMPCDDNRTYPVYLDAKGNPVEHKVRLVIEIGLPSLKSVPARARD